MVDAGSTTPATATITAFTAATAVPTATTVAAATVSPRAAARLRRWRVAPAIITAVARARLGTRIVAGLGSRLRPGLRSRLRPGLGPSRPAIPAIATRGVIGPGSTVILPRWTCRACLHLLRPRIVPPSIVGPRDRATRRILSTTGRPHLGRQVTPASGVTGVGHDAPPLFRLTGATGFDIGLH